MSPEINDFVNPDGRINLSAWRHDICARLLTDHVGPDDGISTNELCMIYFGYVDLEKQIFVGDQLQIIRHMLEERQQPVILRSHRYQWYVVAPRDTAGARGFIVDRVKRLIRSHGRRRTASSIGQQTYALPPADPLVTAIEGTAPVIHQLEAAIEPPEQNHHQEN